jgi:uncharacterized membrane protein
MDFQTGVIKPVECFREGWQLIKDDFWMFFAITLVGMLLAGLIPIVGIGAMFCGIYYCLLQKESGQRFSFDNLFKGFNYLVPGLIATLVIIIPSLIAMIFFYVSIFAFFFSFTDSRGSIGDSALPIMLAATFVEGSIIGLLLGCLHALVMFAYPLIVERKMDGWKAFKSSATAVWQNLNGVVGIILGEFLLGLIGYLLCGVGLYLTLPLMFAAVFVAYRKVFPRRVSSDFIK